MARLKHEEVVKWLVKVGADTEATLPVEGLEHRNVTAAAISRAVGASAEQTAYLESKTHYANFHCGGTGLLKCTRCKKARYCSVLCGKTHWPVHKVECRRWSAELSVAKSETGK